MKLSSFKWAVVTHLYAPYLDDKPEYAGMKLEALFDNQDAVRIWRDEHCQDGLIEELESE